MSKRRGSRSQAMSDNVSLLRTAMAHYQSGHTEQAQAVCQSVLDKDPENIYALQLLGALSHQQQQLEAAIEYYNRAIEVNSSIPAFHNSLGLLYHDQAVYDKALDHFRQAIALRQDYAEAYGSLGNVLKDLEQYDEAEQHIKQAIALNPDIAELHNNLGTVFEKQDKLEDARQCYRQAITINPHYADACSNLANIHTTLGETKQAIKYYERLITLTPNDTPVLKRLGLLHYEQGDYSAAVKVLQQALHNSPEAIDILNNLGNAYNKSGLSEPAKSMYRRAIEIDPESATSFYNLGNALKEEGQTEAAINQYRQASALDPKDFEACNDLGILLHQQGHFNKAIKYFEKTISLKPDNYKAYTGLGNLYRDQGKLDEAIRWYRRSLSLKPEDTNIHSNLLLCLNYSSKHSPEEIYAEHLNFSKQHETPLAHLLRPHTNDSVPQRRLKIGYVSPDFRGHSVAFFIEPVLAKHDHDQYEIFCYYNNNKEDAITRRLQSYADCWRKIAGRSDDEVVRQIRDDGIDILVDLSGHTALNRLMVFARKPAPVQITWLGYPNTTGLMSMDYRITDNYADPAGKTDQLHSERIIRLSETFLCFLPPSELPDVTPLPARSNGHVTFGSFNNMAKITPEVISLWSNLLREIPESRLMLKTRWGKEKSMRDNLLYAFQKHGISSKRIVIKTLDPSNVVHLQRYGEVDISLDSFPYCGTTTNCDSLWMGVPFITLAGHTHSSRVGLSQLVNTGLEDFTAKTPEEYVHIAKQMAANLNYLEELRAGLRDRVARSPLSDGQHFTRNMEQAYRNMWESWCNQV